MRPRLFRAAIAAIYFCFAAVIPVLACQCSIDARGKNAWENARQFAADAGVIFEGTPIKVDLQWDLLSAKEGDLVSTNTFFSKEIEPQVLITFQVDRAYKGSLGSQVQVHTGLGGGDCGAFYNQGLKYLIFTGAAKSGDLFVSMCSPGGWIGDDGVASDLRYLRKERPISADLVRILRWDEAGWAKQDEQRRRGYQEVLKKYESVTGKICGRLRRPANSPSGGSIAFLPTFGYSPVSRVTLVQEDGSFCSENLGPGRYYLYFVRSGDKGSEALYYPGVTDVAKATPVEVRAGQTESNIVFNAPAQSSYSVRGFIYANEWPDFSGYAGSTDVQAVLIRSDGDRRVWFSQTAKRILPRTAYFKIDHVVPGHYIVWIFAPGNNWMARKTELNVTDHMKFISLDLVHKK